MRKIYEIEKNVPMPFKTAYKYPFENMEVGDSFTIQMESSERINIGSR